VKIYDKSLSLSRLTGGNKAFIAKVLPHISCLMSASLEEVVQGSDIIVVAHDWRDSGEQLQNLLRPGQYVVDLVNFAANGKRCLAAYEGVCWSERGHG
jgi:GDP-mannose 6-dehydrogenase